MDADLGGASTSGLQNLRTLDAMLALPSVRPKLTLSVSALFQSSLSAGRVTTDHSNERLDFGGDTDHEQDPGILAEFLTTVQDRSNVRFLRDELPWRRFALSECSLFFLRLA